MRFERHTIAFTVQLDGRCVVETSVTRSSQQGVVIKNSFYARARTAHDNWDNQLTPSGYEHIVRTVSKFPFLCC